MLRIIVLGLLLALLPSAAMAAPGPPRLAYDLQGTTEPSSGGPWRQDPRVSVAPAAAFADAVIPGAARTPWQALDVPAGGAVTVPAADVAADRAWSMALVLSVADTLGARRIWGPGDASDRGLYLDGGVLTWRDGASTVRGTTTWPAGSWHHVVLVRRADPARLEVLLDGRAELAVEDPGGATNAGQSFRLLRDDGAEHTAARVARVRTWDGALTAQDAAALEPLDGRAPRFGRFNGPIGTGWSPLRPSLTGMGLVDDSTYAPRVSGALADETGRRVELRDAYVNPEFGGDGALWQLTWPESEGLLVDARRYTLTVTARDMAGNAATVEQAFFADGRLPDLAVTDAPAETGDPSPFIGGTSVTAPGDEPFVLVSVLPLRPGGVTASGTFPVVGDRWGGRVAPALPPGDYRLVVRRWEHTLFFTEVERPLRIAAAPSGPASAPAAGPASAPTGATSAARLETAAVSRLRRARIRGVLGGERVPFTADSAGTATIRVLAAPGTRARAAAPRVLLSGRRTVGRGGRASVVLRPTAYARRVLRRSRRAAVVVQATFAPRGGRAVTRTRRLTLRR